MYGTRMYLKAEIDKCSGAIHLSVLKLRILLHVATHRAIGLRYVTIAPAYQVHP